MDAIILTGILFLASTVQGLLAGPVVRFTQVPAGSPLPTGVEVDHGRAVVASIAGILLSFAYFVGAWLAMAATPGQRLLRLQVLRVGDHRPQRWEQAAIRWLLLMGPLCVGALASTLSARFRGPADLVTIVWWSVLLLTTVLNSDRRGLHDRASGSLVIPTAATPTER